MMKLCEVIDVEYRIVDEEELELTCPAAYNIAWTQKFLFLSVQGGFKGEAGHLGPAVLGPTPWVKTLNC